jgi:RNA polymerase sigma factor (TIGR02999 family)
MTIPSPRAVTLLLGDLAAGKREALDELLPLVYAELRRCAARSLRRERPGHTLQATALANEAYLRLVDQRDARWQNRAHFLAIAAQAMRRILIDYAREHGRQKRGGGQERVPLDEISVGVDAGPVDLMALDEALDRLAALDGRQARIVELRYFGGMSVEEVAEALAISPSTVAREWSHARAWLRHALAQEPAGHD